jgi:hypothetical protein
MQLVLARCRGVRCLNVERGTLPYLLSAALEKRYGIRELEVRVR